MKKGMFLIIILLGMFMLSCAAKPITLLEKNNGEKINVKVDTIINIKLKSNPTTGYDWYVKSLPKNITQVGAKDFIPDKTSKGIVGAGGTTVLSFKAIKKGSGILTLTYKRNWEGEIPSSKEFSITIYVN